MEQLLIGMDIAARRLHISERQMRKLWQTKQISGVKVGRKVRFAEEDLEDFCRRNRRPYLKPGREYYP